MVRGSWLCGGVLLGGAGVLLGGCEKGVGVIADDFCHGQADGTLCDDGNPCTEADVCGLGVCLGRATAEGFPCEDGDLCSEGGACQGAVCVSTPVDCAGEDGVCLVGTCNPSTGTCEALAAADGGGCDDGNPCTTSDACLGGACAGEARDCSALDAACLEGSCDGASGECVALAFEVGTACDDGDKCTLADACAEGKCQGVPRDCSGSAKTCADGTCDAETGECQMSLQALGTACDDKNPCTDGETCDTGLCGGGTQVVDGTACEDDDACTTTGLCTSGVCVVSQVECTSAGDGKCVVGECDGATGDCHGVNVPDGTLCDDANPCTGDDACQAGICGGANTCYCVGKAPGAPCDDGVACTADDACVGKTCVGKAVDCSGLDDACNLGECQAETGLCVTAFVPLGTPCDDGELCTLEDACIDGACAGGAVDCSALDGECQVGVCEAETGACGFASVPDDVPCDDQNACTGKDSCQAGACAGSDNLCADCNGKALGDACEDGDLCTTGDTCASAGEGLLGCAGVATDCSGQADECNLAYCDGATGACALAELPKGVPCDDHNPCTSAESCQAGVCGSSANYCGDCNGKKAGEACEDGDLCTTGDTCVAAAGDRLECQGTSTDCAAFADQCNLAYCEDATGACVVSPLPEKVACDDGNPCSGGDACLAGGCVSQSNLCGVCDGKLAGESCDDQSPCTTGDTCLPVGGDLLACQGLAVDCSGIADACNLAYCEEASGECVPAPVPDEAPCDDQNLCSDDDRCQAGACVPGANLCGDCDGKEAGEPCEDGSLCTGEDACAPLGEGLLECLGVGTDCSAIQTECLFAYCALESGLCVTSPVPNGVSCDDQNPCSGNDACQAGACASSTNVCGVCFGKEFADPCDDEDPCTVGDACVFSGDVLACRGVAKDCSGSASDCKIGYCVQATGECNGAPKEGGIACWDGEACTLADKCQEGACAGTQVPTCGAEFAGCEEPAANGTAATAATIELVGGARTMLGWLDPKGDLDWYAVELLAGQLLTVEILPHCQSALDTQVAVYDAEGKTSLAYDDDSGQPGGWSKLTAVEIPADGVYTLAIAAYDASPEGTYLVRVEAHFPPPCATDADCECGDERCATEGDLAGQCVAQMPLEVEPNDVWEAASVVGFGASATGVLEGDGDVDWYRLELEAGVPVAINTAPYCGAALDPQLSVVGTDGDTALAFDADGAGMGHALVDNFVAAETGTYYLEVSEQLSGAGAYVITVKDLRCLQPSDCTCPDQYCPSQGTTPMMCAAKAFVDEPPEGPALLAVGSRVQAQIDEAYDVDTYSVTLPAGTYGIATLSYCGEEVDTLMTLYDAGGLMVLEQDDDSGEAFFAALPELTVTETTTVLLEVSLNGPGVGRYVLEVQAEP